MPQKVIESIGSKHDGPVGEGLADKEYVLVQDRAYGKIERFDRYQEERQSFIIRLKDNVHLVRPRALRRQKVDGSSLVRDITCKLGTLQCRLEKRHLVVMFEDRQGHEIRVVTNLLKASAEEIAQIYKTRWEIETFFRWIKQHLNVPVLFGTTQNAVYGQLYAGTDYLCLVEMAV